MIIKRYASGHHGFLYSCFFLIISMNMFWHTLAIAQIEHGNNLKAQRHPIHCPPLTSLSTHSIEEGLIWSPFLAEGLTEET